MGGGSSSSKTTPVDLTPQAFKALQVPLGTRMAQLLGLGNLQTTTTQAPTAPASPQAGEDAAFFWGNPSNWSGMANGAGIAAPTTAGPTTQTMVTGGLAGDPLEGIPGYDGPLVAQLTPNEQAMLTQLQGQATDPNAFASIRDLYQRTIGGDFLPGQEGANPFLQAAIEAAQRPTFQGLEETLSRALPGRFTQAGQFVQPQGSSAFDRAAAIATRGAADAAADIATNMSFAGYEAERGRQGEAAQGLAQVTQQEFEQTVSNLQAQALPRLIEEFGIERGMQEFQTRIQTLTNLMGIASGVTQPVIAQESVSEKSQKPNILGALL